MSLIIWQQSHSPGPRPVKGTGLAVSSFPVFLSPWLLVAVFIFAAPPAHFRSSWSEDNGLTYRSSKNICLTRSMMTWVYLCICVLNCSTESVNGTIGKWYYDTGRVIYQCRMIWNFWHVLETQHQPAQTPSKNMTFTESFQKGIPEGQGGTCQYTQSEIDFPFVSRLRKMTCLITSILWTGSVSQPRT